jgi:uncharacterized protein (DUF433 family)
MRQIRNALAAVEGLGERLASETVKVWVDPTGGLVLDVEGEVFVPLSRGFGQSLAGLEGIDLVRAWDGQAGVRGPDLVEPRPTLRIIPGKLSGEPHVRETRITTQLIAALRQRGLDAHNIVELYPSVTENSVPDAVDLEVQLHRNLGAAA